jgi:cytochrome c peroxidase
VLIHIEPVLIDRDCARTPATRLALPLVLCLAGCGALAESSSEQAVNGLARVPNPPPMSDLTHLPGDLRGMPVPGPANLGEYIADPAIAIALGKALFWDMQVGSDGVQACGTCHFRAGADPRSKNQLNPGLLGFPSGDVQFKTGGPNHQLTKADFPLTRLAVPGVRGALDPATDSNDVVSSQGVHFLPGGELDPLGFNVGDVNTRRVEPRNTPTVINAVFNHRQFRDGRAESSFNGVNHRGDRDPDARVVRALEPGSPALVRVAIEDASLASQAVAPILSDLEMAAPGRSMIDVAQNLYTRRPLARQKVHKNDSVLGSYSRHPAPGLTFDRYEDMIRLAFRPEWWRSTKLVQILPDGTVRFVDAPDGDPATRELPVLEYNFSLFFGLAIQMYEATLVSDETPWDRFRRLHPSPTDPALNPWTNPAPEYISRAALFGAMLFNDRTRGPTNVRCSNCHEDAELTEASSRRIKLFGPLKNRDGNLIDRGYNNIGVRPTADDLGVGGSDARGPLSRTRRTFPGAPPAFYDGASVTAFGVEGAFKIPSLRNIELTGPYYHNGETDSLRAAVAFYSRGGNVAPIQNLDGTTIAPLGVPALSDEELDAIVAFLRALTDERVLFRRAPFDHPQIFIPNGHAGTEASVTDSDGDVLADDSFVEISEVGEHGGAPLPGFLEGPFGPRQPPHPGAL